MADGSVVDLLLVEDDRDLCDILKTGLEREWEGYRIVRCYSGSDALRRLKGRPFDILLTDVRLPGMDGMRLMEAAKALQKDLQTIVITGHGDFETAVEALRMGAANFLTKPLDMDVLHIAIQRAVEKRSMARNLAESEARYRSLFEDSPVPLWEADYTAVKQYLDGLRKNGVTDLRSHLQDHREALETAAGLVETLSVNRASRELYGITGKESPQDIRRYWTPETWGTFLDILAAMARGETWYASETRCRNAAGLEKDILFQWAASPGHESTFDRVLVSSVDITRQKRLEEKLRISQERYALATRATKVGVWDLNPGTGDFYLDPSVKEILGYAPEEIPDTMADWMLLVHPEDRGKVVTRLRDHLEGRAGEYACEHRMRHRDGGVRWILARGKALRDSGGAVRRIVGTDTDITEIKEAEQALRVSEGKLKEAQRITHVGSWEYTEQTDEINGSEELYRILGYEPGEIPLTGTVLFGHVHPDDTDALLTGLNRVLPEQGRLVREFRIIRRDGRPRTVVLIANRMAGYGPRGGRYFGVLQDITDRKRMEREILLAKHRAEEANRAKGDFLANMSHEIRTPISGIIGVVDMALGGKADPETRRSLSLIKRAAGSLLHIINDILDFSKIEAGKMEIADRVFDLHGHLEEIVSLFRPKVEDRLRLSLEIRPDLPRHIYADPDRLGQVLRNLLSNAIKFTEKGGVRLSVARSEEAGTLDKLRFSVADTGSGIAPEKIGSLFSSFVQLDDGLSKPQGGTGLGLAISRRLVMMMGGEIGATSEPGKGSTFHFTIVHGIPRMTRLLGEPAPPVSGPRPAPLNVLVAEDEHLNRISIVHLLEEAGHRVRAVENGRAALEALETDPFDLVLMDIQMPEMDGLEATRRIRRGGTRRAVDPRLPVIALTAYAMKEDRTRFLEAGVDDTVTKPVEAEALFRAMERAAAGGGRRAAGEADGRAPWSADLRRFRKCYTGDPEFFRTMVSGFLEDGPKRMAHLEEALAGEDPALARKRAHAVNSILGALRIESLVEAARDLERCCVEGDLDGARRRFPALAGQVASVADHLRRLPEMEAGGPGTGAADP